MEFTCQDALPLVPSYLDGELTEVRAGMLRKHLLDCSSCRNSAQDVKVLSRWFVAPERLEFAPPAGFSARVARRAFAGDVGNGPELEMAKPAESGRLLQFVLTATAIAAAVMLVSAIALRDQRLPGAGRLDAATPPAPVQVILDRLKELNRLENHDQATSRPAGEAAPRKN
ncbi:MAG TPA: zf-HC2 domain-containing protein [Planctomycetota bacterium]|nr:zf-HC2 domain-containing protein [Planctomycetota bacterium]